jgi:hypothetical protein
MVKRSEFRALVVEGAEHRVYGLEDFRLYSSGFGVKGFRV